MATVATKRTWEQGLKKLRQVYSDANILKVGERLCWKLIRKAIVSPVPQDEGTLRNSATVQPYPSQKRVDFGFNTIYAAFQDQPLKQRGIVTVTPVRKKCIYIPLTRAGKKNHYPGNNPQDEGLIPEVDYVLRRWAEIPIKPYGHYLGPNHYFSKTFRDAQQGWFLRELAETLGKQAS